jgi:hypothetical protein
MNQDEIKDNMSDQADSANSYATRHPRRMWTSAFLIGVGAGMMAATKSKKKSSFQKFLDQFGD